MVAAKIAACQWCEKLRHRETSNLSLKQYRPFGAKTTLSGEAKYCASTIRVPFVDRFLPLPFVQLPYTRWPFVLQSFWENFAWNDGQTECSPCDAKKIDLVF